MKITNRIFGALLLLLLFAVQLSAQQPSVARRWNEAMLQGIREDLARPPVHARNLFHAAIAMWDSWAVYDTLSAETYLLGKTVGNYTCPFDGIPQPADVQAAREKTLSYAMYRLLTRRFQNSPNSVTTIGRFRNLMAELGYDWTFSSNFYQSGDPAALGNYIGDCVSFYGLSDGANESGNYNYSFYSPVNPPMVPDSAGNHAMKDPNHWQPLLLNGAIDQNGNPIPALQRFQSPEWGKVVPFALPDSVKTTYQRNLTDWNVYYDPGPPAFFDTLNGGASSDIYRWNHNLVAIWGSHLDPNDGVMWDISPATVGNTAPFPNTFQEFQDFYHYDGTVTQSGRSINPKTGLPYAPQIVPRGDYTRVLAQFWADGPNSETPPGHWFAILNKAMDHPQFVRKFNGTGPELDPLQFDIKAYFVLGGAVHDAAIAAWGIKGWYDGTRPLIALRWMADRGQSSDPGLPHYSPAGIKLEPGYIELVEEGDPLAGPNNKNVGKIKFKSWLAFDSISAPANDYAGVGWILAEKWWPYQRKTFVTPPFAGYISGHSTYSRAAAEAITLLTGDEYFPGGMGEYTITANSGFLGFEKGPSVDVTLQWATYRDASDQTSLSRIWGGIHPPEDDIPGRKIGAIVGTEAFYKAKTYFYNNDFDADGFDFTVDCDDHNPDVNPGTAETCDGIDNNCNSLIDEGFALNAYYADADGDGFGNPDVQWNTCQTSPPAGYVTNNMDCLDSDSSVYPGAQELCDGLDNDCNGMQDDGLTFITYYEDADGDGYGTAGSKLPSCSTEPPAGFVANNLDCNDFNAQINPGATEICDNIDNDCNGLSDEGLTLYTFYADNDHDGFGNPATSVTDCIDTAPQNFVSNNLDCDDTNALIYTGAAEICDNLDNDCNGQIDEGLQTYTFYADNDGDGFGNSNQSLSNCTGITPSDYATVGGDCDDLNPNVNPNATEGAVADGLDNNCDGLIDNLEVSVKEALLQVKIYPNPVRDLLYLELNQPSGSVLITVSDMQGNVLKTMDLNMVSGRAELSFTELPQGLYMLRVADGKRYGVQRVLKI